MDNKIHIDELARLKMLNHEFAYNPRHWEALRSTMSQPKTIDSILRSSFWKLFFASIGTVVIVGFTALILVLTHSDSGNNGTADNNSGKLQTISYLQQNDARTVLADAAFVPYNQTPTVAKQSSPVDKQLATTQLPQADGNITPNVETQLSDQGLNEENSATGNKTVTASENEVPAVVNNDDGGAEIAPQDKVQPLTSAAEIPVISGMSEQEAEEYLNELAGIGDTAGAGFILSDNYDPDDKENRRSGIARILFGKSKFGLARKLYPETPPDNRIALNNDIVSNPAFTGYEQRHTINIISASSKPFANMNEGMNIPVNLKFSYDFAFGRGRKFALGFFAEDRNAAVENSITSGITFAYKMNIGKFNKLRVGAGVDYRMSSLSGEAITVPDMIDNISGFVFGAKDPVIDFAGNNIRNSSTLNAGVWYSRKNFYAGMALNHFVTLKMDDNATRNHIQPVEFNLSAGQGFRVGEDVLLMPSARYSQVGKSAYFTPSLYCTYKRHWFAGVETPNMNSTGIVIGMYFFDSFMFHISSGISWKKDMIREFGVIDYLSTGLRFQLGEFRKL